MIPYKFLSVKKGTPATGYWDMELINDIFKDPHFTDKQDGKGAIVVLPGAYQGGLVKTINRQLNTLEWCILIITSDEESKFPVEQISHPNIKIYTQYPKQGRHDAYGKWPLGYTAETRQYLGIVDKGLDFFFSGQVTHQRRKECVDSLQSIGNLKGRIVATQGFSKGLSPKDYMEHMIGARVVPCPAGPICADSFRVYEALEAGAIPIADNISQAGDYAYWEYLIGNVPFPTINNYKDLPGYIEDQLQDWLPKANKIQAWYIKWKHDLKHKLLDDVAELTGKRYNEAITVVIPVSPIKSHPDTKILDETIRTIRQHLSCEIIITFDGVRPEQEARRDDYNEFIRRALFRCNTAWNAIPILFDEHMHQSGMLRETINEVKTPLLLYVEQDTPLTPDMPIPWRQLADYIMDGQSNLIRFHFESFIPKDHEHMMLGMEPNMPLMRTAQWSQRPHLASTAYYKRLLSTYFSHESKAFIEDRLHGVLHEAYLNDGEMGWQQHKVHIYHPEGSIKRSYHLDGREGEEKYDDTQRY